jgi:hypothetical protein
MRVIIGLLLVSLSCDGAGIPMIYSGAKGSGGTSASTTIYAMIGYGALGTASTPSNQSANQTLMRTAGSLSTLCMYWTLYDRSAGSIQMQKATTFNTSITNGNLSASVSTGPASTCDLVNTDTVASSEFWGYKVVTGSGGSNSNFRHGEVVFTPSASNIAVTKYSGYLGATLAAGNNYPLPIAGNNATAGVTETYVQYRAESTGTWRNLWINVLSTTLTSNSTLVSRIGAANGAQTISVGTTAGPTWYEDNVDSEVVHQGDLINYRISTGTGTSMPTDQIGSELQTANATGWPVAMNGSNSGQGASLNGSTTQNGSIGFINTSATVSDYDTIARLNMVTSRLQVNITANTLTSGQTATFTMLKNGSAGHQTASVTAPGSPPQWIQDNVNTDVYGTSDTLSLQLATGSGTSVITNGQSFMMTFPAQTRIPVVM